MCQVLCEGGYAQIDACREPLEVVAGSRGQRYARVDHLLFSRREDAQRQVLEARERARVEDAAAARHLEPEGLGELTAAAPGGLEDERSGRGADVGEGDRALDGSSGSEGGRIDERPGCRAAHGGSAFGAADAAEYGGGGDEGCHEHGQRQEETAGRHHGHSPAQRGAFVPPRAGRPGSPLRGRPPDYIVSSAVTVRAGPVFPAASVAVTT